MFDAFDKIQMTLEYSNAVLVAVLPYVNDVAKRLDLALPLPVTTNHVRQAMVDRYPGDVAVAIHLTNGWRFFFNRGCVMGFQSPLSTLGLAESGRLRELYGPVNINEEEAVALARTTLTKLGHSLEDLYADLPPDEIRSPKGRGNHKSHFYQITWGKPHRGKGGSSSLRLEVDAERQRVSRLYITGNERIARPPPKIDVEPVIIPSPWPNPRKPVEGDRAATFVQRVLPEFTEFARRLKLPVPLPIRTNDLEASWCLEEYGVMEANVKLTNGYWFSYNLGYVDGFEAPGQFFYSGDPRVRDFVGRWRMTASEATALVRDAVRKLGYDLGALNMNRRPVIDRPNIRGKTTVPRFLLRWDTMPGGMVESMIRAEVDADRRELKSLTLVSSKLAKELPKPPPKRTPPGQTNQVDATESPAPGPP